MSTLVCTDLITSLEHEIRLTNKDRIQLAAIYPYLFKVGHPAGTFTLSLIQSGVTLFSKSFIESDISLADYAHTFFPVIPNVLLPLDAGLYTIRISSSGYTFADNNRLGWIQQHENIQNSMEYTPINDYQNPLSVRIKIYTKGIK